MRARVWPCPVLLLLLCARTIGGVRARVAAEEEPTMHAVDVLADDGWVPSQDLHVHLDGSVRLSTMIEIAREQGIELPSYTVEYVCGQTMLSGASVG